MKIKKTIEIEETICDICGMPNDRTFMSNCSICGKDICMDCAYTCTPAKYDYDEDSKLQPFTVCKDCITELKTNKVWGIDG